jgi:predicted nucleic acid-binding protein
MSAEAFIDSNVLVYLLSAGAKADRAEETIRQGGVISVQVLNEIANVGRRKLKMSWAELGDFLELVRALLPVEPLTAQSHELGLAMAARYGLSVYDGQIGASALLAGCTTLWSEDMQDGLVLDGRATVRNPFAAAAQRL